MEIRRDLINELPMPDNMRKEDVLDILLKEEYGYLPNMPYSITASKIETPMAYGRFCAGHGRFSIINLTIKADYGEFTFPVYYAKPAKKKNFPCFIHINFRDSVPDLYLPAEEIIDRGFGVLSFCYNDITSDTNNFYDGLADIVYKDHNRGEFDCGKLGLWAYAAMCVLEYALTLNEIDHKKISVVGHSRLGKVALLAGALDERFYCAISNDSGCCGASISRKRRGESVSFITGKTHRWFNKHFLKYGENPESIDDMPFDQHFLIAANFPHKVYIASASEDIWADPENELTACAAASGYYEKNGLKGFVIDKDDVIVDDVFHDGNIAYHFRHGKHYLSRRDWNLYMDYLEK